LTIEIPESHVERISLHSKESQPIEACGILIGTTRHDVRKVIDTWPAKNRLSSESSYEIDPESLFHAFTYAEKNGLEVIAFYHSHPFWSAEASAIDRARANYPGLSYVIYSIPNKEIKSFYFDGKELNSESVIVTTDEHPNT
jgi:proteasome lid subunit RPN8/RPN11